MAGVTKWVPDADPKQARRIGKSLEELGELVAVLGRISIQGIDAIDPASGKSNRQRLEEESADVYAQLDCNLVALGMDQAKLWERRKLKVAAMAEWEITEPADTLLVIVGRGGVVNAFDGRCGFAQLAGVTTVTDAQGQAIHFPEVRAAFRCAKSRLVDECEAHGVLGSFVVTSHWGLEL